MITVINESKNLSKDISCECKCRFDRKKCNSDQWWNNDKSQCESQKLHVCEKNYIWKPATCSCENGKYLASIIDDWANINEKKAACKTQTFYILLAFLLVTIALLIAVSMYCYLMKHRAN